MNSDRTGGVGRVDGYAPIGEYAAIGDGRTLALVARDGSIDWLPLPTLDQASAFGAILDPGTGGSFRLAPDDEHGAERAYVEGTNVLETRFTTRRGVLVVTDALTLQDGGIVPWVELVRRIRCVSGSVDLRWSVEPRFGYGRERTRVTQLAGVSVALGERLQLAVFSWDAGTPLVSGASVGGGVELAAGQEGLLVCVATDNEPIPRPGRNSVETRLAGTCAAWRRWLTGQRYRGPWRAAVERSALALKLLTYAPSGAIAAAGTTGLPERIGGARNYDYRFCWIRDTSFALDALARLGYWEQVHASLSWLLGATESTHPRLPPLYGLDGEVPTMIDELPLRGYRGSEPVTRGNKAATQLQLGTYGYLLDTVWHYVRHGGLVDPGTASRLAESATRLCDIWRDRDAGFWELEEPQHYTSSKLSCWLALTRASALASSGSLPADRAGDWAEATEEIRDFIESRCWSDAKGSYTFHADGEDLDCAALLASQYEFADPRGERMDSTIEAVRKELGGGGPLLYRYSGMEGREGCFLACSFWMVGALARAGRLEDAREFMDGLVGLATDVGLYAEEFDPETREMLGNMPQALTHLSLIQAAFSVFDEEGSDRAGGDP